MQKRIWAALVHRLKTTSYLWKRRPYALEKPIVLQFPVIDICNSHCQMCKIWENKKSDDISPEALRLGLKNPLYSEVTSIGLNGGEPTLRKDLGALATVLFEELPKLKGISLITNAYNYQEVIERISDVGEVVAQHNGRLDVMVSLDGYGDMHDLVRGKPGNFERAQQVIDFITQSPLVHNVRIGCTIIKANVYGLHDLFDYCQRRGLYIKYRLGIPHQRLYTQNLVEPYALDNVEKYHVAEFLEGLIQHYETSAQQNFFYRSLIDQILHNAKRKAGCDWQHRGATISSKGELLYCAVQSKALGMIQKDDSQVIYFANQPHLRDIIQNKCDSCNHDYMGIPPKTEFRRQLLLNTLKKLHLEQPLRSLLRQNRIGRMIRQRRYAKRLLHLQSIVAQKPVAPASTSNRPRVMICGWYGTETLGDKAILGGVIHALRQSLGELELTLVSLYPYISRITQQQMPELLGAQIISPGEGIRQAGSMNLVVFGGGPLMAIDELAEMECIFAQARRHQVSTLIAGCGVGPLGYDWHTATLRNLLALADVRIYRDQKSFDLATRLGVATSTDSVAEDPAFTWLLQQRPRLHSSPTTDKKVLLLGLRDFPYAQYARHLSEKECVQAKDRYELAVVEALKQLAELHPDLVIRPLPMCTHHFGDDDRWFYRRLFRTETTLLERLDYSLLQAELAPEAYCEAFRSAHVALCMRFHSLVFALGLETPAVAIDYTLGLGKVHSLANRFGVPTQSLSDLDSEFLVQQIQFLLKQPQAQAKGFSPQFSEQLETRLPTSYRQNNRYTP